MGRCTLLKVCLLSTCVLCVRVSAAPTSSTGSAEDVNPWIEKTKNPTNSPTKYPTLSPSIYPTTSPTKYPTTSPTKYPTASPSIYPTTSPTKYPTVSPSIYPTASPTIYPTASPTKYPTASPSMYPTASPTKYPTASPSMYPTTSPSKYSTTSPTKYPTTSPSIYPTISPTVNPSSAPTHYPTISPTNYPSSAPTQYPTVTKTNEPTSPLTSLPTVSPIPHPTVSPTTEPTVSQTRPPTTSPTKHPTEVTELATPAPSGSPTSFSSDNPDSVANGGDGGTPTPVNGSSQDICTGSGSLGTVDSITLSFGSLVMVLALAAFVAVTWFRNRAVMRFSVVLMLQYMCFGLVLWNASVLIRVFSGKRPVGDQSFCIATRWLQDMGFVIAISPLIIKSRKVIRVFDNPTLTTLKSRKNEFHTHTLGFATVMAIILTTWTVLASPRVSEEAGCQCESPRGQFGTGFYSLSVAYQTLLVVVGWVLGYRTKLLGEVLSESRAITKTMTGAAGSFVVLIVILILDAEGSNLIALEVRNLLVAAITANVSLLALYYFLKPKVKRWNWTSSQLLDEGARNLDDFRKTRPVSRQIRDIIRMSIGRSKGPGSPSKGGGSEVPHEGFGLGGADRNALNPVELEHSPDGHQLAQV